MISFFISALILTIALSVWLLWPRSTPLTTKLSPSAVELNASIYRGQMAELEADRANLSLSEEDYVEAVAELQRRLLQDTAHLDAAKADSTSDINADKFWQPWRIVLSLFLPVAAIGLYLLLGNPMAANPTAANQFSAVDIENMVAKLANKMEKEPDNLQGWVMLARSYQVLGRMAEAEKAYQRAESVVEQNADLLAAYADAAASVQGNFSGKPDTLIAKALALDSKHPTALWLAGSSAFSAGNYKKAITLWQSLTAVVPADSEEAQALKSAIYEAQSKLAKPSK